MNKFILIMALTGCVSKGEYVCSNFPVLFGGELKTRQEDRRVFNRAEKVCRQRGSCLDRVQKIGPHNYHVMCNRSYRYED